MVFNATFHNISVKSWRSVLLVEETGENHRSVASHLRTWSHNVVSSTPRHELDSNSLPLWWYALIVHDHNDPPPNCIKTKMKKEYLCVNTWIYCHNKYEMRLAIIILQLFFLLYKGVRIKFLVFQVKLNSNHRKYFWQSWRLPYCQQSALSDFFLFNGKWAIVQLCHYENKSRFNFVHKYQIYCKYAIRTLFP